MTHLHLAPLLDLPSNVVTQTIGILGKRGSGKTNAGRVVAEEMFQAGIPFCVVDPVGSWWGLRSSRKGTGPGLAVPIFGGDKGDVPLERESGHLLADLIADQRLSCVLDISGFSEGDKTRFLIDFAERLFQRNRDPLHLFLEEADDFIPQRFMGEKARLVGAWQRIVKRGRSRGLGATMITQRSAAINKDVLTQCETLLVFRTTAPQDMKAIEGWLQYHGQKVDVLSSLPSLKDGEAWVWSPHWLGKLVRVRLRLSETFDSGATPTDLHGRRTPTTLADVNLDSLRSQMAGTIQRAEQDDPKALRRRVAELERQLAQPKPKAEPAVRVKETRVEIPVLGLRESKRIERAAEAITAALPILKEAGEKLRAGMAEKKAGPSEIVAVVPRTHGQPGRPLKIERFPEPKHVRGDARLGKAERSILSVLSQYPQGRTVTQVALLTGYAVGGGAFRNPLGKLRTAGFVEGGKGDVLRITDAGQTAIEGHWSPLPAPGQDLLDYWMQRLGHAERQIVRVLAEAYPKSLTASEVAEKTSSSKGEPYEADGGAFRNPLGRLRTLELIVGRGSLKISDTLMETQ